MALSQQQVEELNSRYKLPADKAVTSAAPGKLTPEQIEAINAPYRTSTPKGIFVPSIARGFGGITASVGGAIGAPSVQKYGEDLVAANPATTNTLAEIAAAPGTTAKEAIGEQVPQMAGQAAAALGGRVVGGAIGSLLGPAGTVAGQQIGSYAGPALFTGVQQFYSARQRQKEQGVDNIPAALASAGLTTAVEQGFGVQPLIRKLVAGEILDKVKEEGVKSVLKTGVKEGVKLAGVEGFEEIVQTPIEQVVAAGQNPLTPGALEESAVGGIKGILGAGPFTAGFSAAQQHRVNTQVIAEDTAKKQSEQKAALEIATASKTAQEQATKAAYDAQPVPFAEAHAYSTPLKAQPSRKPGAGDVLVAGEGREQQVVKLRDDAANTVVMESGEVMPISEAVKKYSLVNTSAFTRARDNLAKGLPVVTPKDTTHAASWGKSIIDLQSEIDTFVKREAAVKGTEALNTLRNSRVKAEALLEKVKSRPPDFALVAPGETASPTEEPPAAPAVDTRTGDLLALAPHQKILNALGVNEAALRTENPDLFKNGKGFKAEVHRELTKIAALPTKQEQTAALATLKEQPKFTDIVASLENASPDIKNALHQAAVAPVPVTPVVVAEQTLPAQERKKAALEQQAVTTKTDKVAALGVEHTALVAQQAVQTAKVQAGEYVPNQDQKALAKKVEKNLLKQATAAEDQKKAVDEQAKNHAARQLVIAKAAERAAKKASAKNPQPELFVAPESVADLKTALLEARKGRTGETSRELLSAHNELLSTSKVSQDQAIANARVLLADLAKPAPREAGPALDTGATGDINLEELQAHELRNEDLRGGLTDEIDLEYSRAVTNTGAILASLQTQFDVLERIVGNPAGWKIRSYTAAPGDPAGVFSQARKIIAIALNATTRASVEAHEGFHYLETNALTKQQQAVVAQAFRKGSSLYKQVLQIARTSNLARRNQIAAEIMTKPREARAYAFQFWIEGKLDLTQRSSLEKIFEALRGVLTKIKAYILSQPGYTTPGDIFAAINAGEFAVRVQARFGKNTVISQQDGVLTPLYSMADTGGPRVLSGTDMLVTEVERLGSDTGGLWSQVFGVGVPEAGKTVAQAVNKAVSLNLATPLHMASKSVGFFNFFHNVLRNIVPATDLIAYDAYQHLENSWVKSLGFVKDILYKTVTGTDSQRLAEIRKASIFASVWNNSKKTLEELINDPKITSEFGGIGFEKTPWFEHVIALRKSADAIIEANMRNQLEHERAEIEDDALFRPIAERVFDNAERLKKEGFLPNRRYGKFSVGVYYAGEGGLAANSLPEGGTFLIARYHYETLLQAKNAIRQIKEEYVGRGIPVVLDDIGGNPRTVSKAQSSAVGAVNIWQFFELAERAAIKLSTEERGRLVTLMVDADSAVQNKLQRREGIQGESQDLLRSVSEWISQSASSIARGRYSARLLAAMSTRPLSPEETAQREDLKAQFTELLGVDYSHTSEDGIRSYIIDQFKNDLVQQVTWLAKLNKLYVLDANGYDAWKSQLLNENDQLELDTLKAIVSTGVELTPEQSARYRELGSAPLSEGAYRDAALKLLDYTRDPNNDAFSSLRKAASLMFLGGSIAAVAVNMSALVLTLVPYLHQHAGMSAYTTVFKTFKNVVGNDLLRNLMRTGDTTQLETAIDQKTLPAFLSENTAKALLRATKEGFLSASQLYDMVGFSKHGMSAQSLVSQRAASLWMAPFRMSEMAIRATAFLAAQEIGVESKKLDGKDLYDFARTTVDQTAYIYGTVNRPAFARNPVMLALYTFKSFPVMTFELLLRLPPKERTIMLGTLFLASGIDGFPFKEDILDLLDTVSQALWGQPFNSNRTMRNYIKMASETLTGMDASRLIMSGPLDMLTGASIGSRVAMGDILPATRAFAAGATGTDTATQIAGAVGSEVKAWVDGAGELLHGNFKAGVLTAAPLAVRNFAKGIEASKAGLLTDMHGKVVINNMTTAEIGLMYIGFTSARASEGYKAQKYVDQDKALAADMQKRYLDEIREGMIKHDQDRVQAAFDARDAWNKFNPKYPILWTGSQLRQVFSEARLPMTERMWKTIPKAWREQYRLELLLGGG